MIEPVLREINNYYFTGNPVEASGVQQNVIQCDTADFEVGQYVYLHNHPTLSGVHKITAVGDGLTVETLADTSKAFMVYPLAIPQGVIDLADAIDLFNEKNPSRLTSEGLGDYSASYSSNDGVASWESAFSKQLASYRNVYLEMPR